MPPPADIPVLPRDTIRTLLRTPKTADPGWVQRLLENPTRDRPTVHEPLTVAGEVTPRGRFEVVCARPWSPKFSVMLWFTDSQNNRYVLRRMNGPRAFHRNRWSLGRPTIVGAHIHCLTEFYLRRQHLPDVDPAGYAVPTRRYGDASGAIDVLAHSARIESQGELPC